MGGGDERLAAKSAKKSKQLRVAGGVELAGNVVEQQDRRIPQLRGEQLDLGDLERQHQRARLSLRGEHRGGAPVEREAQLVGVRPTRGAAARAIASPFLDQASAERLRDRLLQRIFV